MRAVCKIQMEWIENMWPLVKKSEELEYLNACLGKRPLPDPEISAAIPEPPCESAEEIAQKNKKIEEALKRYKERKEVKSK